MAFKRDEAYEEQGKFIAWVGWSMEYCVGNHHLLVVTDDFIADDKLD